MNIRSQAAKAIKDLLITKTSFMIIFPRYLQKISEQQQKALFQELCYGVARFYPQLSLIAKQLLKKPLKEKDYDIYALILLGIYQVLYTKIPQHAAVAETTEAARELKKEWAVNLINAILRQFLRQQISILASLKENPIAKYSHPLWLLNMIKKEWPNEWENIMAVNNHHPPMSLRINKNRISRESYLEKLKNNSLDADCSTLSEIGIILKKPCSIDKLPGFKEGEVSIQDCGAQLTAELLRLQPNHRVLDACAAPGGKTTHILENQPNIAELIAIDIKSDRLQKVAENLQRLHFKASLICEDILNASKWWDGKLFDRILLDAPCSATGVINRHPDIKILRKKADIKKNSFLSTTVN